MFKSTLGDGEIMEKTVVGEDHRFTYTFPNGEQLTSDPVPPEKRKVAVLNAWCDAVRGRDVAIQEQRSAEAAARKRQRQEGGASPDVPAQAVPAETPPVPSSDPDDFIRRNLEEATLRFNAAQLEYEVAKSRLDKWQRLAAALNEGEKS